MKLISRYCNLLNLVFFGVFTGKFFLLSLSAFIVNMVNWL